MSERLGPITFGSAQAEPFLGRDINRQPTYSEATAKAIDEEVHRIVTDQYTRAHELLESHYDALSRIALGLIEREVLSADEVHSLIAGRSLGPVPPAKTLPRRGAELDQERSPEASRVSSSPPSSGFAVPDPG